MAKLTEKQQRFADEYIRLGNATEAARLAGYKKPNPQGAENLAKPSIKSYIDGVLAEMASKRVMDATEAMELLTSIARGEMEETIYIGTADGVETIDDKRPDINQRTAALKEILKRYPIDREGKERLLQAQADKAKAEAGVAEFKLEAILGASDADDPIIVIDPWSDRDG
ncbi:terminase small subunit [Enterococcus diestrammenae]|uniref:terminase small subunit n=1 Tax=Enterococcus diestrammenae TaxID=1155073 RepID=UPI0022E71660|nr:terminase small subunit [Enterococcus diestrammenae]